MPESTLSKRIDGWFKKDYRKTFMERIELLLESENMFESDAFAVKYGKTLEHILKGISVFLQDGEAFAGSVKEEIPSAERYDEIIARYKKWWDIPIEERHEKILFYYSEGWLKCRPPWFASFGHLALDWERLISVGLGGYKTAAEAALRKQTEQSKKDFLNGLILCYDAITMYIGRYAKEAKRAGRKDIAASLERVATGAAQSFYDALALIWMVTLICQKICGCGVLNFGRMDKYLLPYYRADIEAGVLTERQAVKLMEEFYFKNNEIMVQTDHMSQETEQTQFTLEVAYDDPNYLILGGLNPDGSSGVNELSSVMVRATHNLRLRNPFMVVRCYKDMDKAFFKEVCAAMRNNATIVLYNDETMIPALKSYGVEEPEVYDYGFFGCNDPDIGAHEGGLRQVWVNLAKPLELALNRGDYPMQPRAGSVPRDCQFSMEDRMIGLMTGAYYGIDTGDVDSANSIEDVIDMYGAQLEYLIGEYRKGFERDFDIEKNVSAGRMRIEDCFLVGTLENATTWTLGGTKYHKIVTQGTGMATVADALYAIDKLVFKEKKMKLSELAKLLANNFEGNEFLSAQLKKKYDKFGNDIDEVDSYAVRVVKMFAEAVRKYNGANYLYQMYPTLSSDRDFTTMGRYVGATPDGRRHSEKLSENQSPTEGVDISGLTAMLNSEAKIPFDLMTGGPLNIRIHPLAVKGDEGLDVLAALLSTYMQKGGMQVQINVVDADTLRKAQQTPDAYRNLCVRVTGYSAFFVEMGKKAQEELISRTEQII